MGALSPLAIIELVEALTVGQSAVREAERARGSQVAPSTAPTGATRESAEALAAESPTAAGVAAAATADEAPTPVGETPTPVDEALVLGDGSSPVDEAPTSVAETSPVVDDGTVESTEVDAELAPADSPDAGDTAPGTGDAADPK